jgi:shikimate kinase
VATIWVVGMMGAGKTTVGRRVAASLDMPFVDLDDEIAAAAQASIREIFAGAGEARFRELEAAAMARVAGTDAVVATGGGAVERPSARALMRCSGIVVWLAASVEALAERIGDGTGRPLLEGGDAVALLAALTERRRSAYAAAAHHRVETDGRDPDDVAREVVDACMRS